MDFVLDLLKTRLTLQHSGCSAIRKEGTETSQLMQSAGIQLLMRSCKARSQIRCEKFNPPALMYFAFHQQAAGHTRRPAPRYPEKDNGPTSFACKCWPNPGSLWSDVDDLPILHHFAHRQCVGNVCERVTVKNGNVRQVPRSDLTQLIADADCLCSLTCRQL